MTRISWLPALLSGAVLGIGVMVACSDDSTGDADAATCDCPAAEPPLAGRIVQRRGTGPIDPNVGGVASAGCPQGGTLLSGSCRLMRGDRNTHLTEAGISNGGGYLCDWSSTSPVANTGIAEAICLVPPQ